MQATLAVCLVMKEAGSLTAFLWDVIDAGNIGGLFSDEREAGSLTSFLWDVIDAGLLAVCIVMK